MKKFICILLSVLMLLATLTLVACNKGSEDETGSDSTSDKAVLKFGLGVYTEVTKATNADGDATGVGEVAITAAAITADADGKVVACQLDTAQNTVKYTSDGKAIANESFKTKYELGDAYGMVAYGGAAKEWYKQADAFEGVVVGKTLDEIKALVAEGDKGTNEVVTAGCTIMIDEFVKAIEKAFANLAESDATAESTVKLGMNTEQTVKDADGDKNGQNQVETTIFAAALDAEGKVLVADTDCVQVNFTFDKNGVSKYDITKAAASKRELGADYGMVAYSGGAVTKEWFEQADAFNALCVGKTVDEIVALCGADNYGTDAVKSAGCTILVNGFTKAAAKLG